MDKFPTNVIIEQPKLSKWRCYLFGNKPEADLGIVYTPAEGCVPNIFVRWMMRLCLGCTWIKGDSDDK